MNVYTLPVLNFEKEWAASTPRECFLCLWSLHWHWKLWCPLVGLQETWVWPSTTSCPVLPTSLQQHVPIYAQQHPADTAIPHLEGSLPGSFHLAPRGHLASCSWLVCLHVPTFVAHPEWSSLTGLTHILSLSLHCNFSKPCPWYWWLFESASSHSYLPIVRQMSQAHAMFRAWSSHAAQPIPSALLLPNSLLLPLYEECLTTLDQNQDFSLSWLHNGGTNSWFISRQQKLYTWFRADLKLCSECLNQWLPQICEVMQLAGEYTFVSQ